MNGLKKHSLLIFVPIIKLTSHNVLALSLEEKLTFYPNMELG
jgi:hypothetical protein